MQFSLQGLVEHRAAFVHLMSQSINRLQFIDWGQCIVMKVYLGDYLVTVGHKHKHTTTRDDKKQGACKLDNE